MKTEERKDVREEMYDIEQYAHVLLFACPQCGRPLTAVCVSDSKSLEGVESKWFTPACHCGWHGDVAGVTAIKHWVEPWRGKPLAHGEAGSCEEETTKSRKR